jgi:hypothetical protein
LCRVADFSEFLQYSDKEEAYDNDDTLSQYYDGDGVYPEQGGVHNEGADGERRGYEEEDGEYYEVISVR